MNTAPHHSTNRSSSRRATCAPLVALVIAGCGSNLAQVHGSVSVDGRKVAGGRDVRGTVLFSPREAGRPTGSGVIDDSGEYDVFVGAQPGLVPGAYAVAITVTEIVPAQKPGGTPSGRLLTPAKYASPRDSNLSVVVAPGKNTFDFALDSQATTR